LTTSPILPLVLCELIRAGLTLPSVKSDLPLGALATTASGERLPRRLSFSRFRSRSGTPGGASCYLRGKLTTLFSTLFVRLIAA
jgi:hypothetical protein